MKKILILFIFPLFLFADLQTCMSENNMVFGKEYIGNTEPVHKVDEKFAAEGGEICSIGRVNANADTWDGYFLIYIIEGQHDNVNFMNVHRELTYFSLAPNCDDNQTLINNECVDNDTICRDGYHSMTSLTDIDGGATSAICENTLLDDGTYEYDDIYDLFPESDHTDYAECCAKYNATTPDENNNSSDNDGDNNSTSDNGSDDSTGGSSGGSGDNDSESGDSDSLEEDTTDSNTTNDTNSTNSDSNITNNSSADPTGDILDSITASSELAHEDTQRIIDAVTSSSSTAHEDASAIKQHLQDIRNSSHADNTMLRDTMNSNSGVAHTDATDIKNAVDTASATAHEDASAIKEAVEDITGLSDEDKNSLNNAKDSISDSTNTANNNYSSVIDSFNTLLTAYSDTPPVFKGTGDHVFSTTVYGSDVRFDLSLFGDLKPYFDIVFLLMLAWINFKIYRWIFEFLIRIGV